MKLLFLWTQRAWLAVLVPAIVVLFLHASPAPAAKRRAVVIELFTSEGCSSCPPADALLTRLERQQSENGAEVIPLGFHVDYWNYLGWHDRFSSHAYSDRQEKYATRFQEGPYTPQLVVDGETQFLGSDSGAANSAIIQAAARMQEAEVKLSWQTPEQLLVTARTADTASSPQVLLAITEDNLTSNVAGGENGGRVLHHSAVVRELRILGQISRGYFESQLSLKPDKDWKSKDVRLVAFVQPAPVGPIEGAASISLLPPSP